MGLGSRATNGGTSDGYPTGGPPGARPGVAGSRGPGYPPSGSYPGLGVGAIRDHAAACGGLMDGAGPSTARVGLLGCAAGEG